MVIRRWVVIAAALTACGGAKPAPKPLTDAEQARCRQFRAVLDVGPLAYPRTIKEPLVGMTHCEWQTREQTLRTDSILCTGPQDPSYENFLDGCLQDMNDFDQVNFAHTWLRGPHTAEVKLGDRDGKLFLVVTATPGDEYWSTGQPASASNDPSFLQALFEEYPNHYAAWRGTPEGDAWISKRCLDGLECVVGTGADGVSGVFEMELYLGSASGADTTYAETEAAIIDALATTDLTSSVTPGATRTSHDWHVPADVKPEWTGFTLTLVKYQLEETGTDESGAVQHYWAVELHAGRE